MSATPKVFRRERARYISGQPPRSVSNYHPPAGDAPYGPRWPVWMGTPRDPLERWAGRRHCSKACTGPSSCAAMHRLSRLRAAYGRRR